MEPRNTLAAAYAARCNAGNRTAGGALGEEARADSKIDVHGTPPRTRAGLDEAMLLEVLRRSAGPCDRAFASRLAFCLGD